MDGGSVAGESEIVPSGESGAATMLQSNNNMSASNTSSLLIMDGSYQDDNDLLLPSSNYCSQNNNKEFRLFSSTTEGTSDSVVVDPHDASFEVNSLLQKYYYSNSKSEAGGYCNGVDSNIMRTSLLLVGNIATKNIHESAASYDDEVVGERIASMTGSILEQLNYSSIDSNDLLIDSSTASSILLESNVDLFSPLVEDTTLLPPVNSDELLVDGAAANTTFSTDSLDIRRSLLSNNHRHQNLYTLTFQEDDSTNNIMTTTSNSTSTYNTANGGGGTGSSTPITNEMINKTIKLYDVTNTSNTSNYTTSSSVHNSGGSGCMSTASSGNNNNNGKRNVWNNTMATPAPNNTPRRAAAGGVNSISIQTSGYYTTTGSNDQLLQQQATGREEGKRNEIRTNRTELDSNSTNSSTPQTEQPPLYICYPNYTLPNLDFLVIQQKSNDHRLRDLHHRASSAQHQQHYYNDSQQQPNQQQPKKYMLIPQVYKPLRRSTADGDLREGMPPEGQEGEGLLRRRPKSSAVNFGSQAHSRTRPRPFSTNDLDLIRTRMNSVLDPDSLAVLLPSEYLSIFAPPCPHSTPPGGGNTNNKMEANESSDSDGNKGDGDEKFDTISNAHLSKDDQQMNRKTATQNRRRSHNRHRFSLQDHLPEIQELTTEIEKNLTIYNQYYIPNSKYGTASSDSDEKGTIAACGGLVPPNNSPYASNITTDAINNKKLKSIHGMTIQQQENVKLKLEQEQQHQMEYGFKSNTGHYQQSNSVCMTEKRGMTEELFEIVAKVHSLCSSSSTTTNNIDLENTNCNKKKTTSQQARLVMSQSHGGTGVLTLLCPALYSLLSDGLTTHIDTLFGRIPNSVWRVVEASIQYGPSGQSLHELVMRINSEELLVEGPMKFNTFICGLLNLGTLVHWLKYFRTKDRLLRTHYNPDAYLFHSNTSTRTLFDSVLNSLSSLNTLQFQLDLFHELKLLQAEMNQQCQYSRNSKKSFMLDFNKKSSLLSPQQPARLNSKTCKYLSNQLKKSQMKRSYSDERPGSAATAAASNNSKLNKQMPKSKTAINICNQKMAALQSNTVQQLNRRQQQQMALASTNSNVVMRRNPTADRDLSSANDEKGSNEEKCAKAKKITKPQRPKSLDAAGGALPSNYDMTLQGISSKQQQPHKFRQLQLQWELMSIDASSTADGATCSNTTTASNNTPVAPLPGGASGSKIPRPISMTSPITQQIPPYPTIGGGGFNSNQQHQHHYPGNINTSNKNQRR